MGVLVDANKAWKQAQAIASCIKTDVQFALHGVGSYSAEYWLKPAHEMLAKAIREETICKKNYCDLGINGSWADKLLVLLETAIDEKRVDWLLIGRYANIGYKSQIHALWWFTELAKLDAEMSKPKADRVTKGSPLERDINISEQDEVLGNLYP